MSFPGGGHILDDVKQYFFIDVLLQNLLIATLDFVFAFSIITLLF